jgi:hypothetical protein
MLSWSCPSQREALAVTAVTRPSGSNTTGPDASGLASLPAAVEGSDAAGRKSPHNHAQTARNLSCYFCADEIEVFATDTAMSVTDPKSRLWRHVATLDQHCDLPGAHGLPDPRRPLSSSRQMSPTTAVFAQLAFMINGEFAPRDTGDLPMESCHPGFTVGRRTRAAGPQCNCAYKKAQYRRRVTLRRSDRASVYADRPAFESCRQVS